MSEFITIYRVFPRLKVKANYFNPYLFVGEWYLGLQLHCEIYPINTILKD